MILAGWEVSSLVELFLIALLFGTGTDFCLFISWRYAEHLNPSNPAGSMRVTLARSFSALVTSAGTIIVGLLLMGTTHFKLFSSTGPSVAIGLVMALAATLSLTPALLVLLARVHPGAFDGLAGGSREFWERLGRAAHGPAAAKLGFHRPGDVAAVDSGYEHAFHSGPDDRAARERAVGPGLPAGASKFEPGMLAPLTVVLESDHRLSKLGRAGLDRRREPAAVASAAAHRGALGHATAGEHRSRSSVPGWRRGWARSTPAFISLPTVPRKLQKGLTEGAARLRAAIWLESKTGLSLTGKPGDRVLPKTDDSVGRASTGEALASGLKQASAVLQWTNGLPSPWTLPVLNNAFAGFGDGSGMHNPRPGMAKNNTAQPTDSGKQTAERPQEVLLRELTRAAEGAGQIADGADARTAR